MCSPSHAAAWRTTKTTVCARPCRCRMAVMQRVTSSWRRGRSSAWRPLVSSLDHPSSLASPSASRHHLPPSLRGILRRVYRISERRRRRSGDDVLVGAAATETDRATSCDHRPKHATPTTHKLQLTWRTTASALPRGESKYNVQ